VARETLVCELQADDPKVRFDPAAVAACTFDAGCPGGAVLLEEPESPSLCLPPGKAPLGARCVWNSGCESGACQYAYTPDGVMSPCGTCQVALQCACGSNQQCVVYPDHVMCLTLPGEGEQCGPPSYACNNSECIVPEGGGDGVCKQLPTASLGMPCTPDLTGPQCASTEATVFCDHTGHCRAYVAAGYWQPCLVGNGGEANACVGAGWCDMQPTGTGTRTGTCQPPSPDGEPCEDQVLPCLPPARCLQGSCIFPSLAKTCGM
jgi:hypothetical protein